MPEDEMSALERRQLAPEGEPFPNVELFYELVGGILGELHLQHPVPQFIDPRFHYGSIIQQDPQLAAVFKHTVAFLTVEGIIREVPPEKRGMQSQHVLTMKGLTILATSPAEFSPPAEHKEGNLGQILKTQGKVVTDEARKEFIRRSVSGALGFFGKMTIGL